MTQQYTPGPWGKFQNGHCISGSDGRGVAMCSMAVRSPEENLANANLIAAAPELLACQTMGAQANTPDFLDWVADRLVFVYGENPNVDFVLSLRERAKAGRDAIAKAKPQTEG